MTYAMENEKGKIVYWNRLPLMMMSCVFCLSATQTKTGRHGYAVGLDLGGKGGL